VEVEMNKRRSHRANENGQMTNAEIRMTNSRLACQF
jgi:hypothetical protein